MPSTITVSANTNVTSNQTLDGATDASYTAYTLSGPASLSFTDSANIQITSSQAGATLFGMLDSPSAAHSDTITIAGGGIFSVNASGAGSSALGFKALANVHTAFENDGAFTVSGGHDATGAEFDGGGSFTNAFGSQFTVTGSASAGGVLFSAGNATVDNEGTVSISGAVASAFGLDQVTSGSFTNNGTISVTGAANPFALYIQNLNDPSTYTIVNGASGILGGGIMVAGSSTAIAVTNGGTINGDVNLGNGNDTLDSHLGTITGVVTLGSGVSTATLGAENNIVSLGAGTHTVDGGGGTNTVSYAGAAAGVHVTLVFENISQATGVGTDTLENIQALSGSAFADTLEGGFFASTSLTGGGGADTFVYRSGDHAVTVTDFSAAQNDRIDLTHFSTFHSLADVLAVSSSSGSNTVIALGGGTLTLQGVAMGSLTASDFLLSGPSVGPSFGGSPQTGNGTITGGPNDDWLQGGSGNDTLHGGGGSNYLDGGLGLNTATYDGVYLQYTVTTGTPTTVSGSGGTDDLVNIGRIQFTDGYLATSLTDTAAQVYRIYEATLGRAPDQEGLTNWTNALNSGSSLQSVVNGFVNSTEFQTDYGANLTNGQFVTLLYNNVLHRAPDDAGLANWVGYLNSGAETRAQVVTGFSESQEFINDWAAAVQHGLWIADPNAAEVARLYDTVLGRLPDASGLANWTHALETGTSLQSVANGFVGSTEFQAVYGALSNTDFVTLLYHNVLHRPPDDAGLNNWVTALSSGAETRAQVVVGFSESAEHITNTAPHIDSGIWVAG